MRCCSWGGGQCPLPAGEGGYCEEHAPKRKAARDEIQKHYRGKGSTHERNRVLAFARDGWTCLKCGWSPRCVRELKKFDMLLPPAKVILAELAADYKRNRNHLHADHILDVETHPELASVLSNIQTLCRDCHAIKTGNQRGY